MSRKFPEPQCPVRPGDPCSLCYPGATGPQDCGLVWQVQQDPDLQERLAELRRAHAEKRRRQRAAAL
ncbi:DUF6767 domain-containing protein [Propionibacteriaceae bacterium G1746]|uniref:DUF6767 domain-containing protein n=1 Tax=Aestuariimicrobium sp. G57 TaxID=3418485 RepID=UPI003C1B6F19